MFETAEDHQIYSAFGILYMSVPYYALREWWLMVRSRHWQRVQGTIESGFRTQGGSRSWVQLEIWYSYWLNGNAYSGSVRRDCAFATNAERALKRYEKGKSVSVLVNLSRPDPSYLQSGMGWLEPFLIRLIPGMIIFGALALVVSIFRG